MFQMEESNDKTKNECRYCQKTFTITQSLKQHIRTVHEGQKDFICGQCSKSFTTSKNLKQHMIVVHEPWLMVHFDCTKCEKSFTRDAKFLL